MAHVGGAHRAVRNKREHEHEDADGRSRPRRESVSGDLLEEGQGEAWGQILNNTHQATVRSPWPRARWGHTELNVGS